MGELEWTLCTAGSSTHLFWRLLGPIEWTGLSIKFPADIPREPGIYLIRVTLGEATRTYVGEAARQHKHEHEGPSHSHVP